MVKEEQKQHASEGSRSWQLGTTVVMKVRTMKHIDIRGHNYSLCTSFEFSSAILLRQNFKRKPIFLSLL